MSTMDRMFEEREVAEDAANRWWFFLLSGIAWLVFALLVFQWDFTTVYAVSYPVRRRRGVRRSERVRPDRHLDHRLEDRARDPGRAVRHRRDRGDGPPAQRVRDARGLMGFFLLFKGIFDLTVAFLSEVAVRPLVDAAPARDRRDPAGLLGRRQLQAQDDPARGLRRDHRALARDRRADPRLQAQGTEAAARVATGDHR